MLVVGRVVEVVLAGIVVVVEVVVLVDVVVSSATEVVEDAAVSSADGSPPPAQTPTAKTTGSVAAPIHIHLRGTLIPVIR